MTKLIALTLALALTGCSLFMTQNPKPLPSEPDCSGSPAPPILDGVVGVVALFASAGYGVAAAIEESGSRSDRYATTAKVLLLTGLVEIPVALVGGFRVGRCNNAHRAYERMQQQQYYPQQPYPQQPYPQQPYPQQPYPQQPYPQQPYPQPQPQPQPVSPSPN